MTITAAHLRTMLLVLLAIAAGYAAGRPARIVSAQSHGSVPPVHVEDPLSFQFSAMNNQTAFTVYNPVEHTLYVYQGLTSSGTHMSCTFTLHLTRLGGPVERQNCAPGSPF